jgi:hypothetical protein
MQSQFPAPKSTAKSRSIFCQFLVDFITLFHNFNDVLPCSEKQGRMTSKAGESEGYSRADITIRRSVWIMLTMRKSGHEPEFNLCAIAGACSDFGKFESS